MRILSFAVFSSQFNLNNTDGEDTNRITPITITSIDKIINTFILNDRLRYIFSVSSNYRAMELEILLPT